MGASHIVTLHWHALALVSKDQPHKLVGLVQGEKDQLYTFQHYYIDCILLRFVESSMVT
jgi:hypothetical protein